MSLIVLLILLDFLKYLLDQFLPAHHTSARPMLLLIHRLIQLIPLIGVRSILTGVLSIHLTNLTTLKDKVVDQRAYWCKFKQSLSQTVLHSNAKMEWSLEDQITRTNGLLKTGESKTNTGVSKSILQFIDYIRMDESQCHSAHLLSARKALSINQTQKDLLYLRAGVNKMSIMV